MARLYSTLFQRLYIISGNVSTMICPNRYPLKSQVYNWSREKKALILEHGRLQENLS